LAENGADRVVYCPETGYAANVERAEIGPRNVTPPNVAEEPLTLVDTPEAGSIEHVSKLLKSKPQQFIKTIIYGADGQPIAVLLRGDHEVNENKVRRVLGAQSVALA